MSSYVNGDKVFVFNFDFKPVLFDIFFHRLTHGLILEILLINQVIISLDMNFLVFKSFLHINNQLLQLNQLDVILLNGIEQLSQIFLLILLQYLLKCKILQCQIQQHIQILINFYPIKLRLPIFNHHIINDYMIIILIKQRCRILNRRQSFNW